MIINIQSSSNFHLNFVSALKIKMKGTFQRDFFQMQLSISPSNVKIGKTITSYLGWLVCCSRSPGSSSGTCSSTTSKFSLPFGSWCFRFSKLVLIWLSRKYATKAPKTWQIQWINQSDLTFMSDFFIFFTYMTNMSVAKVEKTASWKSNLLLGKLCWEFLQLQGQNRKQKG